MAWQRQNTPKRSKRPDNRLQVKIDFSTIDKYISPLHHHRLIAIGEQRISVCKCYNNKKCCNNKQQTIITLALLTKPRFFLFADLNLLRLTLQDRAAKQSPLHLITSLSSSSKDKSNHTDMKISSRMES